MSMFECPFADCLATAPRQPGKCIGDCVEEFGEGNRFIKPTLFEKVAALDQVRVCAAEVLRSLKPSLGGDCYEYHGGMNDIESLRDAIDNAEGLSFRIKKKD